MHDSRTWRQRTGVKTRSHPPTLLNHVSKRGHWDAAECYQTLSNPCMGHQAWCSVCETTLAHQLLPTLVI